MTQRRTKAETAQKGKPDRPTPESRSPTTEERQRINKWHAEAAKNTRGWHVVRDWDISPKGKFRIVYYVSYFKRMGEENDQSSMRADTKANAQQIARVLNFRKAVPAWG